VTGGVEQTKEERVAETLMAAQRRVKIFSNASGDGIESAINFWLVGNPHIEILAFFPVAMAMATEIASSGATMRVEVVSGGSSGGGGHLSGYIRERYAVGIYYLDKSGGAT